MFFLNFDWEMMTYWAIVGVSHALRYHYEAQDRALRASRLETRLMEAQLQTLQRQLQPHFLFNTLNTISALMHRDVEAADAMLARLGDLLRHVVRDPGRAGSGPQPGARLPAASTSTSSRPGSGSGSTVTFEIGPRQPGLPGAKPFAAATRRKRHPARHRAADRSGPRAGAGVARRFGPRTGSAGRRCRRPGRAAVRSRTRALGCRTPGRGWCISTATITGSRCAGRPAAACRW